MSAIASVRKERTAGVDMFTRWCRDELFTPEMIRATALLERACDLLLIDVYRSLGLASVLSEPRTPSEVAEALGYVGSAAITMDAMLYRLAVNTSHVTGPGENGAYQASEPANDPTLQLAEIWREFDALGPDYVACRRFMEFGSRHFNRALGDDPEFMDRILTGREPEFAQMWDEATNRDPLQDVHGFMGAKAVSSLFPGGTILELGGGTGNGIRHLFASFRETGNLDRIERYIFTDVSMSFILGTRRAITKEYPEVDSDWRFLDINKPFGGQKIEVESVDLVYAVNAAHVAKDIVEAMRECRAALRPGGLVILAERVRRDPRLMAPREISLNLSIYHRTAAKRSPDYRPMHGYLTPVNWERVLSLAGFSDFIVGPELEHLDEELQQQSARVVVAEK